MTKNEKEAEDKENATIELSAGVGGAESGLFCSELYATYEAYANYMGWSFVPVRVDTEKMALTEMMRKAVFEVYGQNVFKYLKFESGINFFFVTIFKIEFYSFLLRSLFGQVYIEFNEYPRQNPRVVFIRVQLEWLSAPSQSKSTSN